MIQTPTACPNADRWQALLADSAGADAAGLEAHLAGCPRCRGVLDELAVGSSGWLRDAGRLAADTDDDPELTRSVHRIYDVVTDADPDIPLDFLKPSNVPGTIGTLGRYQVLAVLGRGATGIVLKALDPDLLRPVAIKVMIPYLASNGTARQRFQREARAAAAVSHDHVVTIHQVDQLDGLQFLVMEYVAGGSLQARLDRDGPMDPREVARIGLQAANGLAAAHAVGLIHRDVKPANILLENGVGRVKLTDFGLARAADDVRLTQTGVAAGTPLYMSPEQARGEVIDHRSDLFSLGSVLYTLLTGVPPFRATTTMGVLNRISNEAPRPIRAMTPDVPADLEAIIMQLLEKDPARRIQFAGEVSIRLSGFLAAPPTPPAPPPPPPAPERPRRRPKWWHNALPILAGILMVAVVLKFKTPSGGTLIVEVDDPDVKVALDGEELTITGAGPQEVRLKPGSYRMTQTKDGKTIRDEFVTINRGDKTIVRVWAEPPPKLAGPAFPMAQPVPFPMGVPPVEPRKTAPPAGVGMDGFTVDRVEQRIKNLLPDAPADRVRLMLDALAETSPGHVAVRRAKDGPVFQTHAAYPRLQTLMGEAVRLANEPAKLKPVLTEAAQLAGTILADTAASKPKAGRLDAVHKQYLDTIDSLAKTPAGPLMILPGPVTDPDKATAGFAGEEAKQVKRLLALRDQIGLLVPQAQKLEHQAETARLEHRNKEIKHEAGTISGHEFDLARANLKAAERALKTVEDTLTHAMANFQKEAAELTKLAKPGAATLAEYKKLTDEYDALTVRLAKTDVGRLLATIPPSVGWGDSDLHLAFGDKKDKISLGRRLLTLREQLLKQHSAVSQAALNIFNTSRYLDEARTDPKKQEGVESLEASIRQDEQKAKFHTEAIRGMMADFRKLADEIDPPPSKKEGGPNPTKKFELD
jgi:serine/threonine protein kinase